MTSVSQATDLLSSEVRLKACLEHSVEFVNVCKQNTGKSLLLQMLSNFHPPPPPPPPLNALRGT